MKERTGLRGQRESQIGGQEKWQTYWCCQDQQRACRMAQALAEILKRTGSTEKKRVASMSEREQLASMPDPFLPKGIGTELSVQSTRL